MNWLKNQISKETWSPYVAGILLGIVGILAVLLSNSLLGASGAFENLAGLVGKAIAPLAFNNMYFNFVMPAGITWGVILLVGVFFGGMLGAATSKSLKWGRKMPPIAISNGNASLGRRPGSAGFWAFLAPFCWNMLPVLRAAVPAGWRFLAECYWSPPPSYSLPACLLPVSSRL